MVQVMVNSSRKKVALACSGGDVPGMNAFTSAFVRIGLLQHDIDIIGIKNGYQGLTRVSDRVRTGRSTINTLRSEIECHVGQAGLRRQGLDLVRLDHAAVSGLLGQAGTVLGSARCDRFFDPEVRLQIIDLLQGLGVEALVVVGGEGSLEGAARLLDESCLTLVGVPATIDGDASRYTDIPIGFDTAVNNLVVAAERFGDRAQGHHRVTVLQTIGRESGQTAHAVAQACGALVAVIPEEGPLTGSKVVKIARYIEQALADGLSDPTVVIADGVEVSAATAHGSARTLTAALRVYFARPCTPVPGTEVRLRVLGGTQRGGPPTAHDRLLAARYAGAAWDALAADPPHSGVIGLRNGHFDLQRFGDLVCPDARRPHGTEKDVQKVLDE
jgi:6-phosphofructokinase 1